MGFAIYTWHYIAALSYCTVEKKKKRSEMHAAREWHDLKWEDELVGQKSTTCKQASLTNQSYVQSVESARAGCQRDQRLKKKKKKDEKKK